MALIRNKIYILAFDEREFRHITHSLSEFDEYIFIRNIQDLYGLTKPRIIKASDWRKNKQYDVEFKDYLEAVESL